MKEQMTEIRKAIQEIILDHFGSTYKGISVSDIADILDKPHSTIRANVVWMREHKNLSGIEAGTDWSWATGSARECTVYTPTKEELAKRLLALCEQGDSI